MKFTCNREQLDKVLQQVGRVVTVRQTLPILSNILIETDGSLVRLSGTDLELAVSVVVPAKVEQEGAFTVPAKVFQELVHQSPDEELHVSLEGTELVCTGTKVRATIAGIDPEEYPALPKVEGGSTVSLPAAALVEALKQVVVACATDPARPVLTGILMTLAKGVVTLAATDSFRLAEKHLEVTGGNDEYQLIVPGRSIQELIRVQTQFPEIETVELTVGEHQLILTLGSVEIYSRLLTGQFPKYQAIIPSSFIATASVPLAEFVQALRLTTIFSIAGIANVLLEIDDAGTLKLSSYGSQRGNAVHTLYAVIQDGFTPIRVAFNARFLLDAAGALNTNLVTLRFSGATSPLVIGTEDTNHLQLVMPIRLDS